MCELGPKHIRNLNDTIIVETDNQSSCSYGFQNNTSYLVFSKNMDNDFPGGGGSCGGNQHVPEGLELSFEEYVIWSFFYNTHPIGWALYLIISISIIGIIFMIRRKLKSKHQT